jgi:hypothetical protein
MYFIFIFSSYFFSICFFVFKFCLLVSYWEPVMTHNLEDVYINDDDIEVDVGWITV